MRYIRHAVTKVSAGENGGRNLESINNVTALRHVGMLTQGATSFILPPLKAPDDGIAVIIQNPAQGKVLGIASYSRK